MGFMGNSRVSPLRASQKTADRLRDPCELVSIPYLSPHQLRHGHAVYRMRRVKDMKQLKNLSQNRLHSSGDHGWDLWQAGQ